MTHPSTFNCFGLVVHGYGWDEVRERVLRHGLQRKEHEPVRPFWIVTANPEILLFARRNSWYWETLRRSDLRIVDGFGLRLAGLVEGARPERITGVELSNHLLRLAEERGWSVGVCGGKPENAERAIWKLRETHPKLRIRHVPIGEVTPRGQAENTVDSYPDVLLVALGHPKQESWISTHLEEMSGVSVVMGIGGTVDFWSGYAKRAPQTLQSLGLEWLWRLIREPRRWRRIVNAVIMFPFAVLRDRIRIFTGNPRQSDEK